MMAYAQFKAMVLNRGYDIDHDYGFQCWDGYAEFCIAQCVPYASCTATGYVQDIWTQRVTNGMLKYFYEVRELQPGDVVVFRPCSVTPTSHIAIFDSDAGGGYGNFLGQNQGGMYTHPAGGSSFNVIKLPYQATYDTAFRLKSSTSTIVTSTIGYAESQLISESGIVVLTQPVKKRRDRPDGLAVETLPIGKKLTYTQKWVGNGHRYISWVEHQNDGCMYRYFVAISGSEKQGVDLWATIGEKQSPVSKTQEHGFTKFKVDGVAIRKGSYDGVKTGTVNSGTVVEYTAKAVTADHRYIIYVKDGVEYWIACSPSNSRSTEWADFYATDPRIETKTENKNTDIKATVRNTADTSNVKHWGVDLSYANPKGSVNLKKYDFAIIQCCYGEETSNHDYRDKLLYYWVDQCKQAGIPYGVYCYDYAYTVDGARLEAEYAVKLAQEVGATLGVWIDMEDSDNWKRNRGLLTADHCLSVCQTFCKTVADLGWYIGIYSSTWWFQNWLTTGLDSYDKWIAAWDANDGGYHSDTSMLGTIHQYSSIDKSTGKELDMDVMYVDFGHYKSKIENKSQNKESNDNNDDANKDGKANNQVDSKGLTSLLSMIVSFFNKLLSIFKNK